MSNNAFNNFLVGRENPMLKDYRHASNLYVNSNYARAPKFGFTYFVQMNINPSAILSQQWKQQGGVRDVGLLVKRTDLPRFSIATETLNQYNRKTVVQSKLTYQPVSLELHDDNSEITHNLWLNYYRYYYADGNYNKNSPEFKDTKFGTVDYTYGRYVDVNKSGVKSPFFTSIDIFVLHRGEFTNYNLINPKITEWAHDAVDQNDSAKVLRNKMTIAYENVTYRQGIINQDSETKNYSAQYYDTEPGALVVGNENQTSPNTLKDVSRDSQTQFPYDNPFSSSPTFSDRLSELSNTAKTEFQGYSINEGLLGGTAEYGVNDIPLDGSYNIFNPPGGVDINIYKGFNAGETDEQTVSLTNLIYKSI
jgi:hypothetical protein